LQLVIVVSYPEHEQPSFDYAVQEQREGGSVVGDNQMKDGTESETSNAAEDGDRTFGRVNEEREGEAGPDPEAHAPSRFSETNDGRKKSPPTARNDGLIYPLVQPLLDETQFTPSGLPRANPIPLIMVSGGDEAIALLKRAEGVSVRRKYYFQSNGIKIGNLIVL
jgi:hypothetical protein